MAIKKTARQRLLDYLQHKQVASAAEIGRALKMSAANARHHLAVLSAQGLVQVIGQQQPAGGGRPALLYTTTSQNSQHNFDRLAHVLLQQLATCSSPGEPSALMRAIAVSLAGQHGSVQGNLSQRVAQAVSRLNQMSYRARWEAHASAPRIIITHCPYAAILADHPALCQMDAFLLEELSGLAASQTARLAPNPQGLKQCIFLLSRAGHPNERFVI